MSSAGSARGHRARLGSRIGRDIARERRRAQSPGACIQDGSCDETFRPRRKGHLVQEADQRVRAGAYHHRQSPADADDVVHHQGHEAGRRARPYRFDVTSAVPGSASGLYQKYLTSRRRAPTSSLTASM